MKILIIPSLFVTNIKSKNFQLLKNFVRTNFINRDFKSFSELKSHFNSAEHYNYSNIVNINGKDNTYIVGHYDKEYTSKLVPKYSRYPSSHSTPLATHINFKEAFNILNNLDCILVGINSVAYSAELLREARKRGILISILDYYDDQEIYNLSNISEKRLTRNFTYKKDFDVFFKHDIPLNQNKDYLYSICPMPINFDNYPKFQIKNFSERKFNVFFSGRKHSTNQNERVNLLGYLSKNIKNFNLKIIKPHEKITLNEYCDLMQNSKVAFSPSGKVWDSTRHSECAVYKNVPLIKQPNCKLANDLKINEDNTIIYDLKNDEKDFGEIVDKINFVLKDEKNFQKMSDNWQNEIKKKNTLFERSKYIYQILLKHLNA